MNDFRRLIKDSQEPEEGQGGVELILILFLVAITIIAVTIVTGPQVGTVFSAVTKGLS